MASIVSSVLFIDDLQQDGRRVIIETHTDDSGKQYQISYMAEPDMDVNARLTQHANDLTTQLQVDVQQGS